MSFTVSSSPPSAPTLTSLTPAAGAVGTAVTIAGANFGGTRGTSTVTFNGTAATPTSWSATSLVAPVPSGATTGSVVVTVGGQASNSVGFTVNSTAGLPAPWAAQDVGGPAVAGQTTYASGTFSVAGAGVDIWDGNDQFQFVYRTLDGDGEIVALVSSLQNTDGWTKGGVMFRQDLTSGAPNATALVSAGNGMVFQQRQTPGGTTASSFSTAAFGGVAPYWVRVVRSGSTFTGYTSATGTAWTLMGSGTVPMASHAYVGLAVTSGVPSTVANATFRNVTVTAGSPPPPPPPPPTLTSLTPGTGGAGMAVTMTGANFGGTQGTSTVTFNGMAATPTSWSGTSLVAPVPNGATTGNIVVTVGGVASNAMRFTVTVTNGVVTATWNANTETDIAGYVLAYGTQTGVYSTTVDVGNVTTWQVTLTSGVRYYFAIKAYNTSLQFSPYSAEVVFDVP
jgi:hypothetical protein